MPLLRHGTQQISSVHNNSYSSPKLYKVGNVNTYQFYKLKNRKKTTYPKWNRGLRHTICFGITISPRNIITKLVPNSNLCDKTPTLLLFLTIKPSISSSKIWAIALHSMPSTKLSVPPLPPIIFFFTKGAA